MPTTDFKLKWDQTGEHLYETGVDRGVVFPMVSTSYGAGAAWNGLTSVELNPEGAEPNPFYANNNKYLNIYSNEDMKYTIGAYTYPDEFAECNGEVELVPGVSLGQQTRKPFGFTYRSRIGNDLLGADYGYSIHLLYGGMASPSAKSHNTINETPEPSELSWEVSTTPVAVAGHKPTAHIEIKSTTVDPAKLAAFEAILYGSGDTEARLPLPDEVAELLGTPAAG
jgi:hypothetical protein